VEIEEHKDLSLVVMIARIFNMLPPVNVKMMENKSGFICKITDIVQSRQFYDMNE
jgi:hypothetical protein